MLDLIESKKPMGILALLDEQCLVPRGTDAGLTSSIVKSLATHPRCAARCQGAGVPAWRDVVAFAPPAACPFFRCGSDTRCPACG